MGGKNSKKSRSATELSEKGKYDRISINNCIDLFFFYAEISMLKANTKFTEEGIKLS